MKEFALTRTQQGLTRGCGTDETRSPPPRGLEKHMADENSPVINYEIKSYKCKWVKKVLLIAFNINLNYNTFHLIAITCG